MKTIKKAKMSFSAGKWPPDPAKPTLVFIHGAGGAKELWEKQVDALADAANTIAIDLPGHGDSEGPPNKSVDGYARAVRDFVRAVSAPMPVPVGLSMGGAIAQTMLLDYPDLFTAGVLVSTGARLKVMPAIIETVENDFPAFLKMMDKFSISKDSDPAAIARLQEKTAALPPATVAGDFRACDAFDAMDRLGEIEVPVLVVAAADDVLTPPKYGAFLADKIEGARLAEIPGAGHLVPLEKPHDTNKAIRDFLGSMMG